MDYGNTLPGQLVVVGSIISSLGIFATIIRLTWRRGKRVNER